MRAQPNWPHARSPARANSSAVNRTAQRTTTPSPARLRGTHQRRSTMTTTVTPSTRNGVDTATLFATLDAVKAAPEAAAFQFRASNQWLTGTHSRSTIHGFFGVGEERTHERTFTFDADHPAILVGHDNGPTPVEYVLHALATCLTAGLANIAAARGVTLTEVRSTV